MIPVRLNHKIRVPKAALPSDVAWQMCEALSIPNLAKENAMRQKVWGWQDMPDTIDLWEIDGQDLVMPRGFLRMFLGGLDALGLGKQLRISDERTWEPLLKIGANPQPRPQQLPARDAIIEHQQGIYKAPAGSGKTVSILMAMRKLGCKSIVIVNTKDIAWQWIDRTREFLGDYYPTSQIGDGQFEVSPYLTIATAQTLHSRFDALEADGFFDQFSFMCLDECHHATAETYNRLVNRFSARYRVGVSATPDKTGDFALATHVLGPIFHQTTDKELRGAGILIEPEVFKVQTDFKLNFRSTTSRFNRSNYPQMVEALVNDRKRNSLIVRTIMAEKGHHQLVLSKRLAHLDMLGAMLIDAGFPDTIIKLTGKEKNAERQLAVEIAATSPCAVLSTLADEAMDVPRLDRAHLALPQKNAGLITQQIGRVERAHPDKRDAKIFDYADVLVGPFERQWQVRKWEVYEPRGFKVTIRKPNQRV